ncbi:aminoglycoside phosphotransferase [Lewinellaceae bacterium SD302]|nr:aminoglycoside phosphotransferase [Lewinellaceae bacterium SD302]
MMLRPPLLRHQREILVRFALIQTHPYHYLPPHYQLTSQMTDHENIMTDTGMQYFFTEESFLVIEIYLDNHGLLKSGEKLVKVNSAGAGNMNLTLRLETNRGSYILKQSRPYVEKYPQVDAPIERVLTEAAFLQRIAKEEMLAKRSPDLLNLDAQNYALFMQDLGHGSDLSIAYAKDLQLREVTLEGLIDYLSVLHAQPVADFPGNLPLRRLNHEHIFVFPYLDAATTGLDLDTIIPGLAAIAKDFRADEKLRATTADIGERYLAAGPCLLHGDFYPGSWLEVDQQTYVIDAEFAHPGRPEYDLGVMIAHLHFAGVETSLIDRLRERYQRPQDFEPELVERFAGLELIRRLIGLAQLPLDADLEQRRAWLELGRSYVLNA